MGADLCVGHQTVEEILVLVHADVEVDRNPLVGPGIQPDFLRAQGHVGRVVAEALAGAQFKAQGGRLINVATKSTSGAGPAASIAHGEAHARSVIDFPVDFEADCKLRDQIRLTQALAALSGRRSAPPP